MLEEPYEIPCSDAATAFINNVCTGCANWEDNGSGVEGCDLIDEATIRPSEDREHPNYFVLRDGSPACKQWGKPYKVTEADRKYLAWKEKADEK
jgi:hypothetical protein